MRRTGLCELAFLGALASGCGGPDALELEANEGRASMAPNYTVDDRWRIVVEAQRAQRIQLNPDAHLQQRIAQAGLVATTEEFRVEMALSFSSDRRFVAQRAEDLRAREVRVFFAPEDNVEAAFAVLGTPGPNGEVLTPWPSGATAHDVRVLRDTLLRPSDARRPIPYNLDAAFLKRVLAAGYTPTSDEFGFWDASGTVRLRGMRSEDLTTGAVHVYVTRYGDWDYIAPFSFQWPTEPTRCVGSPPSRCRILNGRLCGLNGGAACQAGSVCQPVSEDLGVCTAVGSCGTGCGTGAHCAFGFGVSSGATACVTAPVSPDGACGWDPGSGHFRYCAEGQVCVGVDLAKRSPVGHCE